MKTLESILRFYINSSIHVAIAIIALVKITLLKSGGQEESAFLFFCFICSIIAYNCVKYSKVSKLHHRKLNQSMKIIWLFTLACGIMFVYLVLEIPIKILLFLLPYTILTILYVVPIFPNKKNLRDLAGVKVFIVGLVWAGFTVLFPLFYIDKALNLDMSIETFQRFLFVIVSMLPFEIRDLQFDSKDLITIPQKIGVFKTKIFGSVLLALFFVTIFLKSKVTATETLSSILIAVISLLFLWKTKGVQTRYYCSFWVESIPIMWLLIILLLEGGN